MMTPSIIDLFKLTFELGWPEAKLIQAENGREGIKLIESQFPDVIVLDLSLPDINGFEVLKEIRRFSCLPILVLTPDNDEKAIVKVFTWGANGCLIKPLRQMELLARVKALSVNRRTTHPKQNPDFGKNETLGTLERDRQIVGQCPKCASIHIFQEGCFTCPVCGFSR